MFLACAVETKHTPTMVAERSPPYFVPALTILVFVKTRNKVGTLELEPPKARTGPHTDHDTERRRRTQDGQDGRKQESTHNTTTARESREGHFSS